MPPASPENPSQIARSLRRAVSDCSSRGLLVASRWAAELLASLPSRPSSPDVPLFQTSTPARSTSHPRQSLDLDPEQIEFLPEPGAGVDPADAAEEDRFRVGKAYFDGKELERCANALAGCVGPTGRFLRLYSRYLASERRCQEEVEPIMGTKDMRGVSRNTELRPILEELGEPSDPFLLYLKGIILDKLKKRIEAMDVLIRSVSAYPYNWSAWLLLASCVEDTDELTAIEPHLPQGVMLRFFSLHVMVDLHAATEELHAVIDELAIIFPHSLYLRGQCALVHYNLRQLDEAERIFEEIFAADPYRTEDLDLYSNILYVMENRAKLSSLAHSFIRVNKNRPEVCCLIGNYYSLRQEHERAIVYFRRALRLDKSYLSAWTLMGHEYVELKNTHAAIEAYRRAIDVNRKDYRAWYGLGQTYELLDMPRYALHYYQRAAALRPYDTRMWQALASNYEKLNRIPDAIKCNQRCLSLSGDASDAQPLLKLARLYERNGEADAAATQHRRVYDLVERSEGRLGVADYAGSYMYLAAYEMRRGNGSLAGQYLEKLVATNATEREEAVALLRRLRQTMVD